MKPVLASLIFLGSLAGAPVLAQLYQVSPNGTLTNQNGNYSGRVSPYGMNQLNNQQPMQQRYVNPSTGVVTNGNGSYINQMTPTQRNYLNQFP